MEAEFTLGWTGERFFAVFDKSSAEMKTETVVSLKESTPPLIKLKTISLRLINFATHPLLLTTDSNRSTL